MQDLSDAALVERCLNADRAAWDRFVQRFSGLIYWAIKDRLSKSDYLYRQQDIEDIFQNVFVLLWRREKLRQIRNRASICAWLAMVAANCTRNYLRNEGKFPFNDKFTFEKVAAADCSAAEALDQRRLNDIMDAVLAAMPQREMIILKLKYLYDKTHRQIGEILQIPTGTVSSIIKRTKQRLKAELKAQGWEN